MNLVTFLSGFLFLGWLLIPFTFLVFIISLIFFCVFLYFAIRRKNFRIFKTFLLFDGIILGFLILMCGLVVYASMPPSSEKFISNYFDNKESFNNLVKRIQIDQKKGLERIDDTWTRPSNLASIGISNSDLKWYRNEFEKLGIPRGFYAFPDHILFIAYTFGLSVSGSDSGYVYSESPPKNYFKENCGYSLEPFKDLKDYKGCNGYTRSYTIYQKIDENWYIYDSLED